MTGRAREIDGGRAGVRGVERGADATDPFMDGMDLDTVRSELDGLRAQFDKVKSNVKDKAVRVDDHLHAHPYPYLLGAFGLGVLAGGLLMKRG